MFRRSRRPVLRRIVAKELRDAPFVQAQQMQRNGKPEESAALFTDMAGQMAGVGRMRQAANLHAEAAHAWLDAGQIQPALDEAREAMDIFSVKGMLVRGAEFSRNFSQHLRKAGYAEPADGFEQAQKIPVPLPPDVRLEKLTGQLPGSCPQCGAPVRSDQVEWVDANSAECDFCSAVIKIL